MTGTAPPDPEPGASTTHPDTGTGTDPDDTPTTTAWQEYLAAAQSLDAVRREAAAEAAAVTRAASTARAELARVSAELERQRATLAARGVAPPQLVPGPADQSAAADLVTGDPATVPEALRQCRWLVADADAQLGTAPPGRRRRRWWWPFSR